MSERFPNSTGTRAVVIGHVVEAAIADGAERGAPPEVVAEAVTHALTSHRPRIRYPVGPLAGRMTFLARVLPDRWLDVVLRRTFTPQPETATAATIPSSEGARP